VIHSAGISRGLPRAAAVLVLICGIAAGTSAPRAEVLEEIVAFVNGNIITKSQLEDQEEALVAEAYKRFTGGDLDKQVAALHKTVLLDMIDQRILLDRAKAMFSDLDGIKQMYFDGFKESQGITDDNEFATLLQQEGMTIDEFKDQLLEIYAPGEVLRLEVKNRISVGNREVEQYYLDHLDDFKKTDEVTVREIVLLADTDEARAERRPEAEKIVEQARAGQDFAALAKEYSESGTKNDGGLLGKVHRGDLSRILEEAAFGLAVGEVSDPLETPYGFHILKVESRTVDEVATLEEAREPLREMLEANKYDQDVAAFRTKIRSEAEWCVRRKYRDRVSPDIEVQICES